MNANEPVGYFRKNYDGDWVEADAGYEDDAIPLYTHPAKTLTDSILDEIHSKLVKVLDNWRVSNLVNAEDGEPFPLIDLLSEEGGTVESGKHEVECIVDELVYEIKTILRKAQEV